MQDPGLYAGCGRGCKTGLVEPENTHLKTSWDQIAALPAVPVNQAIAQLGIPLTTSAGETPDAIYLSFGNATPPLLSGDEAEKRRQLAEIGTLHIAPGSRFVVSRPFVEQLIDLLVKTIEQYDTAVAAGQEPVRASNG